MKLDYSFSFPLLLVLFISQVKGHQDQQEEDQVPEASDEQPEQVPDDFFPFDSREFVKSIFKMLDLDGKG